jgi:hypothetical protein
VALLIADAEARERLAECARQRILATYRWGASLDRLEELVGAAARPPAGGSLDQAEDVATSAMSHQAATGAGEARRA